MILALRSLADDRLGSPPAGEHNLVLRAMARRAIPFGGVFEETDVGVIVRTD